MKKSKPHEPVSEAVAVSNVFEPPVIFAVDKLFLCVPMSQPEMHGAIDRALDLVKTKELTKGSLKREFHNHKFVLHMPSGEKAVMLIDPNKPNMKWPMLLRLNPHEITDDDSKLLLAMFKILFANDAARIAASMRIARIDECADSPHKIENLIIERNRSKVGSKFFIGTGADAKVQSSYMGSVSSDERGHAYDKMACDPLKYTAELLSKKFPPRDAELHIKTGRGLTRIENRRVFAQPVTMKEFAALQNPFGDYHVTDLSKFAGRKLDLDFLTYLDCVRLRGVNGARRFLKDASAHPTDTSQRITEMEKQLSKAAADWWSPEAHNASAMEWLKNSPIWRFVCIMQPKSIRKKSH